ncbi:MAG: hypothetical protein KC519_00925, partial [Anaerolineae bacterium]|nr:hypothetical protein [Anaerolineae bacterium]
QAESSYGYQQRWDGDHLGATTSQYEIEHRFIATMDYTIQLFGNNDTRFALVFNRQSGEPYSVTFDNGRNSITGASGFYGGYDLAYIPSGVSDPNVQFANAAAAQNIMQYIDGSNLAAYKGTYVPRDAFRDPWQTRLDLRITQEIRFPQFAEAIGENRAIIYFDIVNLGNLLDSGSGIVKRHDFNTSAQIITNGTTSDGKFIVTGIDEDDSLKTESDVGQSSWQMRLGFKYEF